MGEIRSKRCEGRELTKGSTGSCDYTTDMGLRSADYFIANLERYVAGESLHHVVDKSRGY